MSIFRWFWADHNDEQFDYDDYSQDYHKENAEIEPVIFTETVQLEQMAQVDEWLGIDTSNYDDIPNYEAQGNN